MGRITPAVLVTTCVGFTGDRGYINVLPAEIKGLPRKFQKSFKVTAANAGHPVINSGLMPLFEPVDRVEYIEYGAVDDRRSSRRDALETNSLDAEIQPGEQLSWTGKEGFTCQ